MTVVGRLREWTNFPPPPPIEPYPGNAILGHMLDCLEPGHVVELDREFLTEFKTALDQETGLYWQGWQLERRDADGAAIGGCLTVVMSLWINAIWSTTAGPAATTISTALLFVGMYVLFAICRWRRHRTIRLARPIHPVVQIKTIMEGEQEKAVH